MRKTLTLLTIIGLYYSFATAQSTCPPTFAKTIGGALTREGGNSIAIDEINNLLYVAGYTNDSTLLIKMTPDGDILWTRAFDVLRNELERVAAVILDSDGMIVISGMTDLTIGGKVYMMKYDPALDQVLWTKEYKSHSNDYGNTMIEKGPGGNYLMANNPFSPNDCELFEIDRSTGNVNPDFSKHYSLGGSNTIFDLVMHNDALYATGRFSDGAGTSRMRNMLTKLNANDGIPVWLKLGHRPSNATARLYGADLVIDQNSIYSTYHGDPDGTDLSDDKLYIQKTSLDGQMEWLKQYEVSGTADVPDEIISTGDGFVIMGRNRGPSNIFLFKINHSGDVLWARHYDFSENDNTFFNGGSAAQLVRMDDALYFTAYAEQNSRRDMILVKTDSEGQINDDCIVSLPINIEVTTIENTFFYSIQPTIFTFTPQVISLEVSPFSSSLQIENTCLPTSYTITSIDKSICLGDSFEGYDQAGIYSDTFSLPSGCDSIRILDLRLVTCDPLVIYDLDLCSSFMSTGSNMDYSEFIPTYPNANICATIEAGILHRSNPQVNKHSCTPGLNSTNAMCVSSLPGCNWIPGHEASVIIEINVIPEANGISEITGLQFYEKAPLTYEWIGGDIGLNNYPNLFGIRILKNGTEIYSNPVIETSTEWSLHEFNFVEDTLFEVDQPTLFRIELLPYCPVGNGAEVSAWDLEDIVILGGCVAQSGKRPTIMGEVLTNKSIPVAHTEIHLASHHAFPVYQPEQTNQQGGYSIENLDLHSTYYLKGYNDSDVLKGVSTIDLIAIQKHLLGIAPFISLDQFVAADINHDGRVNASDLIALRKVLLGYTPYFPQNTSWRFGTWPQSLVSEDPSTLQEAAYIEAIQPGNTTVDFLAIKIGDLNGDVFNRADGTQIKPRHQAFEVTIKDYELKPGIPFTIDVLSTDHIISEGLQISWQMDGMTLVGVKGGVISLNDEHVSHLENGILRLSWVADQPLNVLKGDKLFSLTFTSDQFSSLANTIHEANDILHSEIYSPDEIIPVKLSIGGGDKNAQQSLGYFTIDPNPFSRETNIRFQLFQDANVTISLHDISGQELHRRTEYYTTGVYNQSVSASDIGYTSGVLFCRIVSGNDVQVKKVVSVK